MSPSMAQFMFSSYWGAKNRSATGTKRSRRWAGGDVARLEDRPEQEGDGEQKEVAEPAKKGVVEVSGEVVIQGEDGVLEHQLVLVVLPADDFAGVVQDVVGRGVDIDELKRGVVIVQMRNVDGRADSDGKGDQDGKEDCGDAEYDRSAVAHHAEGMVSRHARIVSALGCEPAVSWKRSGRAAVCEGEMRGWSGDCARQKAGAEVKLNSAERALRFMRQGGAGCAGVTRGRDDCERGRCAGARAADCFGVDERKATDL